MGEAIHMGTVHRSTRKIWGRGAEDKAALTKAWGRWVGSSPTLPRTLRKAPATAARGHSPGWGRRFGWGCSEKAPFLSRGGGGRPSLTRLAKDRGAQEMALLSRRRRLI